MRTLAALSAFVALTLACSTAPAPSRAAGSQTSVFVIPTPLVLNNLPTPAPTTSPTCTQRVAGPGRVEATARDLKNDGVLVISDGKLWAWSGAWRILTADGPLGRDQPALVYDPASRRVLLHGGRDIRQASNPPMVPITTQEMVMGDRHSISNGEGGLWEWFTDTWAWDGGAWTRLRPAREPDLVIPAAAAVDLGSDRVLVLGLHAAANHFETWSWQGGNWTQVGTSADGDFPGDTRAVYDPISGRVLRIGGFDHTLKHFGTAAWDGSSWVAVSDTSPAWYGVVAASDAASRTVLAVNGGTTWMWDGSAWHDIGVAAPAGYVEGLVDTPAGLRLVGESGGCPAATRVWAWTGTGWRLA